MPCGRASMRFPGAIKATTDRAGYQYVVMIAAMVSLTVGSDRDEIVIGQRKVTPSAVVGAMNASVRWTRFPCDDGAQRERRRTVH